MDVIETVLQLKQITKTYPGVVALDKVSLEFGEGEIHALMGENGAGKSTLIKVVSGAITPDSGEICVGGKRYSHMTPALSKECGIGVIYQEFNLVGSMSAAENVFLGERVGGKYVADFSGMQRKAQQIFSDLGVDIDPAEHVDQLSTAKQQVVEIAKAMSQNAKILIMDEPSASLANAEVQNMLDLVMRLKEKGVTIIYISHRMDEVFQIADRVSVLRDGCYIATEKIGDVTRKKLIKQMVGRELKEEFAERKPVNSEVVLEVKNLSGNGDRDISFQLRKGEILGFAGLVGAGRTELAKMLYGAVKPDSGEIYVKGQKAVIHTTQQAISHGIGLIPEDRKNEGAFLEYPIDWNVSIMSIRRLSKFFTVMDRRVKDVSKKYADRLRIKTPTLQQKVKNLSGGNQQKVVLAKVLAAETDIVILDEPTRGIDVGAKQEIYQLMDQLVAEGISIIMISSEMEELIGMSDRIIVLHEGRITGEISRAEFDQNRVLAMASGEKGDK